MCGSFVTSWDPGCAMENRIAQIITSSLSIILSFVGRSFLN